VSFACALCQLKPPKSNHFKKRAEEVLSWLPHCRMMAVKPREVKLFWPPSLLLEIEHVRRVSGGSPTPSPDWSFDPVDVRQRVRQCSCCLLCVLFFWLSKS
jgi:hypothetical protein